MQSEVPNSRLRLKKSSSRNVGFKKSATRDRPEERPKCFMQSVIPAAFREKKTRPSRKNVVHPVCILQDSVAASSGVDGASQDAARTRSSLKSSRKSYRVKIQVLHGLDLLSPCGSSPSCSHTFLPTATIALTTSDLGLEHHRSTRSCQAAQHARNHTLWSKENTLEVNFSNSYSASESQSARRPEPERGGLSYFTIVVSLTSTCSRLGSDSSVYIGETEALRMPVKDEDCEIAQFFPVWGQLSSKSAIGPYSVGKIKLKIRFEVEKAAVPATPAPLFVPPSQSRAAVPGRSSFLPANFADALNTKRKQLKAIVASESVSDAAQRSRTSPEFDAAASERILKEITADPTLRQIPADLVQFLNPIGEGIHSSVLHGRLRSRDGQSAADVAIKEFRYQHPFPPPNVLATFRREYQLLEKCTSEDARQIVKYLGVLLTPRPAIIMEFFPSGSLQVSGGLNFYLTVYSFIFVATHSLAHCMQNEASWCNVSLLQKARMAVQIAEALSWLHIHDIVHRDVKSHNILLDRLDSDDPVAKICDVGSAVHWRNQDPLLMEETGSSGYAAPEIFTNEGYTSKVDVWGFGIVLWELLRTVSTDTRNLKEAPNNNSKIANPFVGIASDKFVGLARTGTRPICCFSGDAHSEFEKLVRRCWQFDPSERPTMGEVTSELHAIIHSLSDQ